MTTWIKLKCGLLLGLLSICSIGCVNAQSSAPLTKDSTVDEILDAHVQRNKLEYLVKWVGYDNPNWEKAKDINDLQAIDRFHDCQCYDCRRVSASGERNVGGGTQPGGRRR